MESYRTCTKCGGENEYTIKDCSNYIVYRADTVCKKCGHKNYWGYIRYESARFIESKCEKFT